jgi:hypothetical protein
MAIGAPTSVWRPIWSEIGVSDLSGYDALAKNKQQGCVAAVKPRLRKPQKFLAGMSASAHQASSRLAPRRLHTLPLGVA